MRADRWPWAFSLIMTISIETFSPSAHAEPNPRAGKAIAGTCDACHGNNGIAVASDIPNLAGQHYAYLLGQLEAFKQGVRKGPIMVQMARALTKEQMQDLSSYYASVPIEIGSQKPGGQCATQQSKASP